MSEPLYHIGLICWKKPTVHFSRSFVETVNRFQCLTILQDRLLQGFPNNHPFVLLVTDPKTKLGTVLFEAVGHTLYDRCWLWSIPDRLQNIPAIHVSVWFHGRPILWNHMTSMISKIGLVRKKNEYESIPLQGREENKLKSKKKLKIFLFLFLFLLWFRNYFPFFPVGRFAISYFRSFLQGSYVSRVD